MTNRQSVDARAACAFRARASSGTAGTLDGAWISLQFFSGRPLERSSELPLGAQRHVPTDAGRSGPS
jgi:hypothetical protein